MRPSTVVVLGGGMIGSVVASDMASAGFRVTVADLSEQRLRRLGPGLTARRADLSEAAVVRRLAQAHDLVIGALPSAIGFRALQACIEAGRDCVDISFMPEDPLELDEAARRAGATVVVDCGVAPGISNMMVGFAASRLQSCRSVEIHAGGLPLERRWPFDYKAGFAPADVIEEYVRPARVVENGAVVVKEALSEPELMDVPGVGTLEAFNTDGLRTLIRTIRAPFMKEKTLRYPGHAQLMRAFRETGLFSKEPLRVADAVIRPMDATAALLFPRWTFEEREADLTVLRVRVTGIEQSRPVHYAWDLLDRYDAATGLRSMSRTTAFPAAAVARLVASGRWHRPGISAPESLGGEPGLLDAVLGELRARGVDCRLRSAPQAMSAPAPA